MIVRRDEALCTPHCLLSTHVKLLSDISLLPELRHECSIGLTSTSVSAGVAGKRLDMRDDNKRALARLRQTKRPPRIRTVRRRP